MAMTPEQENKNQKVLVGTGLSSDIGQALLKRLGLDWDVISLGRSAPSRGQWVMADFRQSDDWLHELAQILPLRGPVQGVVHLAGLVYSDVTTGVTRAEWADQMAVNLTSIFLLGQTLRPFLSSSASLVLVGSVDATLSSQDGPAAAYGAAKAGLYGLMRQWAAEWGPDGIRVNAVAPGALSSGNGPRQDAADLVRRRILLRRLGEPDEVAAVIEFLLSDASRYVTGAWIPVDGGLNIAY